MGIDRDPIPACKVFIRNVVVLFLALYRVFKSTEPLSFDSPVKTDSQKVPYVRKSLCPPQPGFEPETSGTKTARSSHSAHKNAMKTNSRERMRK